MNSSCSFTLFVFVAVFFFQCLTFTEAATCHPDDEAGLLAFKSGITRDTLGILSSWKKGTYCCDWIGVTCLYGDRVTELRVDGDTPLGRGSLSGTISPSLVKLQHLEGIYFGLVGNITGSFPKFIFRLPKLKVLNFNNIRLSGPLPANIGALSQLEELTLDGNRFTGPVPSSISNLTRLTWLSLNGNRLSGPIPEIFKSMTKLTMLDFSRNRFSGKLPPSLASLAPNLTYLDLSQNNLSGTIPGYLSRFKELSTLVLSKNRLLGVVPMSLANLPNIHNLDLSHNLLTGPFPSFKNGGIGTLDLSYNQFNFKSIPEWLASSADSSSLKLAKCGIKMNLDDWRPKKIKSIYYIDLSENEISGSPTWFLNQTEILIEFKVSGNKLRFDLGKVTFAKTLTTLGLSRNLVFGKVPATVAKLEILNLSQNHLCGKLPATKSPASAFVGNDCLCGSPLSPCKA